MACDKVELSRQNRKAGATLFAMNKITQDMRYKQAVVVTPIDEYSRFRYLEAFQEHSTYTST